MKFSLIYLFSLAFLASNAQLDSKYDFNSPEYENQYLEHSPDCAFKLLKSNLPSVEMEPRTLFYYTHPKLKSILKDEQLMEGQAHLYKVEENIFLVLDFYINSLNAKKSYGDLDAQSQIKISFDNEEYIYLENIERDRGRVDRRGGKTEYQGVYPIPKSKLKQLRKHFIYKMGVMWEEGYEVYNVINIDLIKNQISCLE
ncbi:MAG: hypothetical protein HKN09_05070 [Saprospiraceae bacterium]|nr:hypothetical protein [Saprospiraceae bacterium]